MKRLRRLLAAWAGAFVIAVAPGTAHADRGTALRIVGFILVAAGPFTGGATTGWGYALIVAGSLVSATDQRRDARRQLAKRRREALDALQARNITGLTSEPPQRGGYGRCLSGGDVFAIFTTDRSDYDWANNATTRPDGLRHLVIRFMSRQISAIHEVYIDNVPVGALDANGYPTGGEFLKVEGEATLTVGVASGTSLALPTYARPATAILASFAGAGASVTASIDAGGNSISATSSLGDAVTVTYKYTKTTPLVRISKFLGSPTQAVDPYLFSLLPTKWTADHRLRGQAGIVITLDLEDQRFQGGLPNITAEGSWALVYDPRKDSTQPGGSGAHRYTDPATWEWSANPALCTADWLCSELGYACDPASDIDWAYVMAAANACDATGTFDDGSGPYSAARYTCNGAFTSQESREGVLEDLTESMAGWAVPAAQWQVMAGAWTPPVDTLTDDDLAGSIEVVQADTPTESLINSARGRYIPSGKSAPTEANPPYTNPTLVTADQGVALFEDFALPYTTSNARVRDLLRVKVEQRRNGLLITYPAKLRKWGLRVGERVYVVSSTYGWAAPGKAFRITDRRYSLQAPVNLLLQEDDPSIWDQADAATADPTPNTNLPNPYAVAPLSGFALASSETTAVQLADGTWQPAIVATWSAITDRNSLPDGVVELRWIDLQLGTQNQANPVRADGQPRAVIMGVKEGQRVLVLARVRNRYGKTSGEVSAYVQVVGKTTALSAPTGLTAIARPGGVDVNVTPISSPDFKELEVRYGASWAAGTLLYRGSGFGFRWHFPPVGTHTVRAKFRDFIGLESAEASTAAIVAADNTSITNTYQETTQAYVGASTISGTYGFTRSAGLYGLASFTLTGPAEVTFRVQVTYDVTNSTGGALNLSFTTEIGIDSDGTEIATQSVRRAIANTERYEKAFVLQGVATLAAGTHICGCKHVNRVGAGILVCEPSANVRINVEVRYK